MFVNSKTFCPGNVDMYLTEVRGVTTQQIFIHLFRLLEENVLRRVFGPKRIPNTGIFDKHLSLVVTCHFVESEQLYICWKLLGFSSTVLTVPQVKVIICVCVILSLRHAVAGTNACQINLSLETL